MNEYLEEEGALPGRKAAVAGAVAEVEAALLAYNGECTAALAAHQQLGTAMIDTLAVEMAQLEAQLAELLQVRGRGRRRGGGSGGGRGVWAWGYWRVRRGGAAGRRHQGLQIKNLSKSLRFNLRLSWFYLGLSCFNLGLSWFCLEFILTSQRGSRCQHSSPPPPCAGPAHRARHEPTADDGRVKSAVRGFGDDAEGAVQQGRAVQVRV